MWNSDRSRRQVTAFYGPYFRIVDYNKCNDKSKSVQRNSNWTHQFRVSKKMKKSSNTLRKAFFFLLSSQLATCSSNVSRSWAAKSRGLGETPQGNFTKPKQNSVRGFPDWTTIFYIFWSSLEFTQVGFLIPWFQGLLKYWIRPSITPSCYTAYAKTETQIPKRKWHLTNLVESGEAFARILMAGFLLGPPAKTDVEVL